MSRAGVIRALNVSAEHVKPRDLVAVRGERAVSVSNLAEFHTTIRFDNQRPLTVAKVAVVTVYRKDER